MIRICLTLLRSILGAVVEQNSFLTDPDRTGRVGLRRKRQRRINAAKRFDCKDLLFDLQLLFPVLRQLPSSEWSLAGSNPGRQQSSQLAINRDRWDEKVDPRSRMALSYR